MSSSYQLNDKARRKRASRSLQALRSGNDVERVVFFSDAVFAIAMTLLVLDLKLPALDANNPHALADALRERSPAFVGFALSFWIVASLWHGHHDRFSRLERYNGLFVRINLLLLFFVAFLPLPTALMFMPGTGSNGAGPALYGLTIGLAYLTMDVEWWYAHRAGLLSDDVTENIYRRTLLVMLPMASAFLISAPIGLLLGAWPAYATWLVGFVVHSIWERALRARVREREMERLRAEDAARRPDLAEEWDDAWLRRDAPDALGGD